MRGQQASPNLARLDRLYKRNLNVPLSRREPLRNFSRRNGKNPDHHIADSKLYAQGLRSQHVHALYKTFQQVEEFTIRFCVDEQPVDATHGVGVYVVRLDEHYRRLYYVHQSQRYTNKLLGKLIKAVTVKYLGSGPEAYEQRLAGIKEELYAPILSSQARLLDARRRLISTSQSRDYRFDSTTNYVKIFKGVFCHIPVVVNRYKGTSTFEELNTIPCDSNLCLFCKSHRASKRKKAAHNAIHQAVRHQNDGGHQAVLLTLNNAFPGLSRGGPQLRKTSWDDKRKMRPKVSPGQENLTEERLDLHLSFKQKFLNSPKVKSLLVGQAHHVTEVSFSQTSDAGVRALPYPHTHVVLNLRKGVSIADALPVLENVWRASSAALGSFEGNGVDSRSVKAPRASLIEDNHLAHYLSKQFGYTSSEGVGQRHLDLVSALDDRGLAELVEVTFSSVRTRPRRLYGTRFLTGVVIKRKTTLHKVVFHGEDLVIQPLVGVSRWMQDAASA